MIYTHLKVLLQAHGIHQPYACLVKNGFPERAARQLAAGKYKVLPLAHLERLCLLLHCTPNDLLRWQPEPGTDTQNQPLAALINTAETGLEWMEKLHTMNVEELRALGQKLRDENCLPL